MNEIRPTLLTNATVIDGVQATPRANAWLRFEQGRITAIGDDAPALGRPLLERRAGPDMEDRVGARRHD